MRKEVDKMDKSGIREIEDFLKSLRNVYAPEKIIIFGSRARGDNLVRSDYDIVVVSRKFENVHFLERISNLLKLWDYDYDIDILPYTPKEFEQKKKEIGIVAEAINEGIEV